MEHHIAKVNICSAGGTAGKDSKTCKISLPTTWVEALGITKGHREPELAFDRTKITLSQHLSDPDFAKRQLAQSHKVYILRFYDRNDLCSMIYADFTTQTVAVENQAVPTIKTAFGNNLLPNWKDFQRFLEDRCIPRKRAGLREYLETLGLDEYDPLAIIEKTGGRMAEDQQWLTIEVLK